MNNNIAKRPHAVYCLPFPLLRALHLEPRKKAGVVIMFSLGFVSVACTVGRCVVSVTSGEIGLIGMLGAIEQASAITVVCIPALKSFIQSLEMRRDDERSHCSSIRSSFSGKGSIGRILRRLGWKSSSKAIANNTTTTRTDQKDTQQTVESTHKESAEPYYVEVQSMPLPRADDQLSGLTAPPRRSNLVTAKKGTMGGD